MDTIPFEEAILRRKVAQICDHVGYTAITQDSWNVLVDFYRRLFHEFARHCKDAANRNRRIEPTLADLEQAFNFIHISIPDLQEHLETVKLPLKVDLVPDTDCKPSKGIQRNLIDDLLEAEKNSQEDVSENGVIPFEEEEKPQVPLLKDVYEGISKNFPDCTPVSADKEGRIVLDLKISLPAPSEPKQSFSAVSHSISPKPPKVTKGKRKKRSSDEIPAPAKSISPIKTKKIGKGKKPGRKKLKATIAPLEPPIAESPPLLFPDLEEEKVEEPVIEPESKPLPTPPPGKQPKGKKKKKSISPFAIVTPAPVEPEQSTSVAARISPKPPKETTGKRKKRSSNEILPATSKSVSPIEPKEITKTKKPGRKKLKAAIAPLDPSIAEPPSFFPILESRVDEPVIEDVKPQPTPPPGKQPKGKKKKKSNNQFAIVTETVTAAEEKEWFCPGCGGPDDGDLWVQCDSCQEWYHLACTGLSKPPEDDENWECDPCGEKAKKASKKPQTPVVEAIKLKTPEPVTRTPTPVQPPVQIQQQQQQPQQSTPPPPLPQVPPGTSQDDLCPECNLPDDGTMMIQCDDPFCAKWFHGKCVNLLEEPKEDESWFCKVCVEKQKSAFTRRRRPK